MTDARLDAAQIVALTRATTVTRQLDAGYIAALTTGSPAARVDAAYIAVLTPATLVINQPMLGYWGALAAKS